LPLFFIAQTTKNSLSVAKLALNLRRKEEKYTCI
jgi:hypothetical protein